MALNDNALTTVAAVQALTSGSNDDVEAAVNAVSQMIEDFLGRKLYQHTFTEEAPDEYQGSGRPWLLVRHYPITEVDSVRIDDQEVTDYRLLLHKAPAGLLFRVNGWPRTVQRWGDLTRDTDRDWADYNIKLAYTGGYVTPGQATEELTATLPASIQQAATLAAVHLLENGSDYLVRERTPGGWEREWSSGSKSASLPLNVVAMLMPYRARP